MLFGQRNSRHTRHSRPGSTDYELGWHRFRRRGGPVGKTPGTDPGEYAESVANRHEYPGYDEGLCTLPATGNYFARPDGRGHRAGNLGRQYRPRQCRGVGSHCHLPDASRRHAGGVRHAGDDDRYAHRRRLYRIPRSCFAKCLHRRTGAVIRSSQQRRRSQYRCPGNQRSKRLRKHAGDAGCLPEQD